MSYSLTAHEIGLPDFMTRFWHANCMTSLRGHRTPLQSTKVKSKTGIIIKIPENEKLFHFKNEKQLVLPKK